MHDGKRHAVVILIHSTYYRGNKPSPFISDIFVGGKLVGDFDLDAIDLLKIDCEGGEYVILSTTPARVLRRVKNLVFEFHEIPGFVEQLKAVKKRLVSEGFEIRTQGHLVYATRS